MSSRRCRGETYRLNFVAAAVAACFASGAALANPTGPAVANGQVTFHQQGNLLQITNSPNAIINWQGFSIGANEITRFLQQSASSAVLNRVISQNPSSILGLLQSNGRVFLINPNGILFGPGSQVDVAGLVASSLNLSDADFLAGRLQFTEVPGAGSIINQGAINSASGGQVYLVGPAVTNEGVITSPQGEVILAAGNSVELVDPGTPNLRVEITAPDNEAVNLGQVVADSGRVGIYAGLVKQSGTVQANTAQVTEDGRIVLKATKGVTLEAGSMTAASGVKGGNVTIGTETGTIQVAGRLDASGSAEGGSINLEVTGDSGSIDLGAGLNAGNAAVNVDGPGHTVTLSGDMVTAGAPISINDSVELGAPASITLDTTDGGAVAGGANITITGAVDDDVAGSSELTLSSGTAGVNTVGGAIGGATPIASLTTSGNTTFLNNGAVTTTGGQTYNSPATFAPASLTVNAGADVTIGGNVFSGPQSISATGDIAVTPAGPGSVSVSATGSQTVVAGGALNVTGAASGANRFAQVIATGDQNISASSINITGGGGTGNFAQVRHLNGASGGQTLTVNGGDLVLAAGSGGANNRADIRGAADQSITVIGGGELSLQGGSAGANNQARIRHEASGGDQTINVADGDIVISGGSSTGIPPDTGSNFARIENRGPGNQTVNADTITMAGGPSGDNNFAGLQAAHQLITTTGNVVLAGGAGSISGARIGAVSDLSDTDVTLNVGGALTLNGGGGSGASVGSNRLGGRSTDIVVTSAGDVTLNPGPGSGARIGSPSANVAGGNVALTSGGNIALNSAGGIGTSIHTLGDVSLTANAVMQGSDSTIQANQLTVNVNTGADLGGTNQLAVFNSTGGFLNGVMLNNGTPLLTVTGVDTFGGPLALDQAGDLMVAGNVLSGAQSINVTGDMTVAADSSSVRVQANGPQTINAGGTLAIQGAASGTNRFARVRSSGTQNITAANIALTGGTGGTGNFADIRQSGFGSDQNVTVTGGGTLSLHGGLGGTNNQARIRLDESSGNQTVNVAGGGIVVTGGSNVLPDTGNNFARIENRNPATQQTINADTIAITGGPAGGSNFAGFHAAHQQIAATGDVALTGGDGSISGARIGGFGSLNPTDLTLNVGGALTLTGGAGSGASLGSNRFGGQPTDIVVMSAGDITSDPGTGSVNRFGSPSIAVAGGNISLTSTGGDIALNSAAGVGTEIRTFGDVALTANAITQGNDSVIQADQLTTVTNSGTSLGGNNQVARFNASNFFGGDVLFNNTSPLLTVTGVNQTPFSPLMLTQDGDLTLTGGIFSGPQSISATGTISVVPSSPAIVNAAGSQTINAGGGLIVESSASGSAQITANGGQTIDAEYVEVTAQGGNGAFISNFVTGNQTITTHGANAQGEGIAVRSQGGFALIDQDAFGFAQSITANNADYVRVIGESGPARIESSFGGGTQTLALQGAGLNALEVGSTTATGSSEISGDIQTITAGLPGQRGSIALQGGVSGGGARARILGRQGQDIAAANIALAGGAGGTGNSADFLQTGGGFNQNVTVRDGGTLSLQGGGGTNNFARIRNNAGNQQINVAGGAILISGGDGPDVPSNPNDTANNYARIRSQAAGGVQTIIADTIMLAGGIAEASNFAGLQAANQFITTSGDVTLQGGAGSNSGARIGGVSNITPTNAVLNVGGNLALNGGTGAGSSLGSNRFGNQPTDIVVNAAGGITLNPGSGTGARIGSPSANVAGGDIVLTSGGSIALNSAGGIGTSIRTLDNVSLTANAIAQGDDSVIQADQLTVNVSTGADLDGANRVSAFNSMGGFLNGVTLNNGSPLLAVTGINTFGGPLTLTQDGDLTLTGGIFSGPQMVSATGDISVVPSSPALVNASGPQTISAGGGLIVESSALGSAQVTANGGQTINSEYVEVTAQGGNGAFISNFVTGNQTITTHGANAQGEGIAVRSQGGFALIDQDAFGFAQSITANNADYVRVIGESGPARIESSFGGGTQTLALQGAGLNALQVGSASGAGESSIVGGIQAVTAGLPGEQGSISLHGGAGGAGASALIMGAQGQDISAANIALAGGAGGTGNSADFLQSGGGFNQNVTVRDGGTLSLQGGGGTNNSARIRNDNGNQTILGSPVITVTGGTGSSSFAMIRTRNGTQTITAGDTSLMGGAGGFANFAVIQAPEQYITVHGDLSLAGRDSARNATGSSGVARMGGPGGSAARPTDLVLNVDGDVMLTGGNVDGAGAAIGSASGQNTDVVMTAGGNITLNPGTVTGASSRIGSQPGTGGNISLTSGGNIALNSNPGLGTFIRTLGTVTLDANAITQGDDAVIEAGQLFTTTAAGTSLGGQNQVAVFNATNGAIGSVMLHNASPSLMLSGISTNPVPFTLMQEGDLMVTGDVWSGPQTINVTGDMTVGAESNSVILYAAGPRRGMGRGEPHASWKALGVGLLDRVAGHSPINISARSLSVRGGNGFGDFAMITGGPINITTTGGPPNGTNGDFTLAGGTGFGAFGWVLSSQDIHLNIGGNLKLEPGTGFLSFARMQTVHPTSKINIFFPNLSSGGYFVNGIEGAYRKGLSGFYTGPVAARPGKRLITTYGQ